jgi:E3 ubiquitin-protein ligase TRIP12
MSSTGYVKENRHYAGLLTRSRSSSRLTDEPSKPTKSTSKRPPSRNSKKPPVDTSPSTQTPPARRQKKRPSKKEIDAIARAADEPAPAKNPKDSPPPASRSDSNDAESPRDMDEESRDPFASGMFGASRGHPMGLSNTLRALSGMMSGMSARLREILNNLRQVDNPSIQLVALEELSNLLLVSNEDNLSGQFSPDPYVKELVSLMQPNPITQEENPEMMLLACRCIANLMEALRGSVANVVYGGAVPVLCQKLLDIQYIDVAEQALSTLSKVSIDFPGSIVREGGLTACLQFLDFFATGTQRTAVTTAANCCRNIPHDSFPVIRDVMPILLNVLSSHDQKVVEQGCLCVTRVIDSFKHSPEKLEQLVDAPLLRAVLGLLLPGTTNMVGSNIHTEFLRVLAIVARASPRLSAELLKMNVVDTLYQILTGVSPPSDTSEAASKIDSVVIMQALIHRPREQVFETLNVICDLLPRVKSRGSAAFDVYDDLDDSMSDEQEHGPGIPSSTQKRLELFESCKAETRRFAIILLPTLTDAYSSTVNLSVRQKVLTAQLKILSNLETAVVEEALRPVPYASFLASILSQEDHPSLVMYALHASELLIERLQDIYQYQFYREGVIGEIKKLSERPLDQDVMESFTSAGDFITGGAHPPVHGIEHKADDAASGSDSDHNMADDDTAHAADVGAWSEKYDEGEPDDDDEIHEDDEEHEDEGEIVIRDEEHGDDSADSESSDEEDHAPMAGEQDMITMRSKKFLELYETSKGYEMRDKASNIRRQLQKLALEIESCYTYSHISDGKDGKALFKQLAHFFDGDALESITSSELLESGIIKVLLSVFSLPVSEISTSNARGDFLQAFMSSSITSKGKIISVNATSTAFSVLISKLQDLLSRAEHFEVLTVNSSASEPSRGSSTSMLSRQLRLKLSADSESEIPASYRDIVVSIHAIATFKALDDYLRPRISLSERVPSSRRRDMLQQLANARMRELSGASDAGLFTPFGTEHGFLSPVPPELTPENRAAARLASKSKHAPSEKKDKTSESKENKVEKPEKRRSSRRHQTSTSAADLNTPAPQSSTPLGQLEMADEKHDSDGLNDADAASALNAIVDDLQDEMSDDEPPEPSAINMEIASTGKVTARREDGTRIATPMQPGTPVPGARPVPNQSPAVAQPPQGSLAASGRPFSYAAAVAATPQDWHIEFSIDDKQIPKDTTIYRAVYRSQGQSDPSSRNMWSGVHSIKFKKVKGPPPASSLKSEEEAKAEDGSASALPASLDKHPTTSAILSLLSILHDVNANLDEVQSSSTITSRLYPEPLAAFINTKLTAKMNRQLEEPLIVASNCLPNWSEDLARLFPFLFPFETRHLFLQSTSFGYSRSMMRWQSNQSENDERRDRRRDERPLMGRLQRQKVRISRSRILESAVKVMEMYGSSPSVLEVEYFEEVGTGLGPTLEFYSTVSKEFSKKKIKLWRENDAAEADEYAFGKGGLFPAPMSDESAKTEASKKLLHFFKMLGKFVARSMLDSRIIDISFSSTFFKLGNSPSTATTIAMMRTVDQDLANSLAQLQHFATAKARIELESGLSSSPRKQALQELTIRGAHVEDLMLDFTLPGYPSIELVNDGSNVPVTTENVDKYIERVLDLTLGSGVRRQIDAFAAGFSQVFSFSSLRAFTPAELVMLFGRVDEDWSIETLMDSIKADHGFNMDSKSIKNLLQTMSELVPSQRRDFLQFVTGSPKLPIGGFKSLTPMFTVVCKPSEPPLTSDDYLPSVMTCVNYLKLPDYSDQETMRKRLNVAIQEGQGAFHLS